MVSRKPGRTVDCSFSKRMEMSVGNTYFKKGRTPGDTEETGAHRLTAYCVNTIPIWYLIDCVTFAPQGEAEREFHFHFLHCF